MCGVFVLGGIQCVQSFGIECIGYIRVVVGQVFEKLMGQLGECYVFYLGRGNVVFVGIGDLSFGYQQGQVFYQCCIEGVVVVYQYFFVVWLGVQQ